MKLVQALAELLLEKKKESKEGELSCEKVSRMKR